MASTTPTKEYMIFRPEKIRLLDILSFLFLRKGLASYEFVESSGYTALELEGVRLNWLTVLILIIQKILSAISTPLKLFGYIVEFLLNLLSLNGGLLGLIWHVITVSVVIPKRGAANFRSIIAHIDGRIDLYKSNSLISYFSFVDSQAWLSNINLLDVSTMAAKIAYENPAYIQDAVTNHWKMHFVGFYDCWNKFLEAKTTQAFIFSDKAEDADLIVVAFRGTEPFTAEDWSTDIDLSWISMGKLGCVHIGFLKALGLQDEKDYQNGFPKDFTGSADKPVAYYTIREALKTLLKKHKNAKILVTGHSLGGALAAIFPSLLSLHEQDDVLNSMYGVMTYGQPRVGDATFGSYMETVVRSSHRRMVYRYDIVPRVPLDLPPISLFKHFGTCVYYRSWYEGQVVDEVPNPNYFDPKYLFSMYFNAWSDLFKALLIGKTQGKDFKEGYVSILFRALGLIIPGVASHSPRDYVNAERLAKITNKVMA